jgi:hypothetical protein
VDPSIRNPHRWGQLATLATLAKLEPKLDRKVKPQALCNGRIGRRSPKSACNLQEIQYCIGIDNIKSRENLYFDLTVARFIRKPNRRSELVTFAKLETKLDRSDSMESTDSITPIPS